MKSAEVFNPDAKKPNQSGGKGGNTTLSSSRRMTNSRTEWGNLHPGGSTRL